MSAHVDPGALQLEVYQGLAGLEVISDEWRKLAGQCARLTFCHYPEWYECYLRCLAPDPNNVFFCLLRRNGLPVVVAPLERRFMRTAGFARRCLFLPQDAVNMPIADFTIAQTENMDNVAHAILTGSASLPELQWDRVHLARVPDVSCCADAVRTLRGYPLVQQSLGYGDRVALEPFDQMLQKLPKSARKSLTLARNRLARAGNVRFCTVSDETALAKAMDEFIDVEASGWKGRKGTAIKCNPRLCAYYRMLAARFGARGQCDIHTLYVNNRPAAAELALRAGHVSTFLKCGYDETFAALSPGNSLDAYAIQYYYENTAVRVVDLLSDYAYLRMWNPSRHPVYNLSVFNRSWTGVLNSHAARGWHALQSLHGAVLSKEKRLLRRLGCARQR